jgi:hypothetical protein
MIAFDFLYDPRTALADRLRSIAMSRQLLNASIGCVVAAMVVASAVVVEHSRVSAAEQRLAALQNDYAALRARLTREKLEAGEAADLGVLDGRLRIVASSGSALRERMTAVARDLPRGAWLVSFADDGTHLALVARSTTLTIAAATMMRLGGTRFGPPTLERVSRVERPGHPLLEFAFSLARK